MNAPAPMAGSRAMADVPYLTATCRCGKSISIECPTVADIPAAQERMAGWGHDDWGRVRCPGCRAGGSPAGDGDSGKGQRREAGT